MNPPTPNLNIFISYSHEDEVYFKEFSKLLNSLAQNRPSYKWHIWEDTKIHVGTFWDNVIQNNIENCNVAILLVSAGFMNSQYIAEKEYEEFKTRYAKKGILIVPVLFKPCDYTYWKELKQLQFFKPSGNKYGKPDIDNFTFSDLLNFTYTHGSMIPNPNLDRYILDLITSIELSFTNFLEQKKDSNIIIPRIDERTQTSNSLSTPPFSSQLFKGRESEIKEFIEIYQKFRLIVIEGLGGIGKTNFAVKCIERLNIDPNKITWLNGSSSSNFNVFVECAGYTEVLRGESKSDLALYSGLKDLIEKDERVIFWDNFSDYEDPSFSRFINFSYPYLKNSTLIIISKIEPSFEGITSFPIIKLEGLEKNGIEYARLVKSTYSQYNFITESDLEIICSATQGHPLAIEFSISLMSYGKSANDIVHRLAEFTGLKKVENFSKRLFLDILYDHRTSEHEKQCLLNLSVFQEFFSANEINHLYDGIDNLHLLAGLIDKLLLSFKNGYYSLHPLIRSFSYELLNNKEIIHKKVAEYFIFQRNNHFNGSLEEKIFYHLFKAKELNTLADSIEERGNIFIHHGQLGLLIEFMNKLLELNISRPIFEIFFGDIAQIKGDYDIAKSYFERASESTVNISVKAEGLLKFGEILFRKGDYRESQVCFEKAYDFAVKNKLRREEARAINDIGLVYHVFNDFKLSLIKHNAALRIREEIEDKEGISFSYNNIAQILEAEGKFDKALFYLNNCLAIKENLGDQAGLALTYSNLSRVYFKQKNISDALKYNDMAYNIAIKIGDKAGLATCINSYAIELGNQGDNEGALLKYQESLKIFEEIGDKNGISNLNYNIGDFYFNENQFEKSIQNLMKGLVISNEIGLKANQVKFLEGLTALKHAIGKDEFKYLSNKIYNTFDKLEQKYIQINEINMSPSLNNGPKIGRNDLCDCGSGKKYKYCHGRN